MVCYNDERLGPCAVCKTIGPYDYIEGRYIVGHLCEEHKDTPPGSLAKRKSKPSAARKSKPPVAVDEEETMPKPMHNYTDSSGRSWNLNDPATYEGEDSWFPTECRTLDARGLRDRIQHEIGSSLYYMICIFPGFDHNQYNRVVEFGKHFARESRELDRRENRDWLRKQLFLILDETENQC